MPIPRPASEVDGVLDLIAEVPAGGTASTPSPARCRIHEVDPLCSACLVDCSICHYLITALCRYLSAVRPHDAHRRVPHAAASPEAGLVNQS